MGALTGAVGLILVAVMLVFSVIATVIGGLLSDGGWGAAFFGGGLTLVFAVIGVIIYTVFGFIVGCIYASLYNLLAKHVGGLELEVN